MKAPYRISVAAYSRVMSEAVAEMTARTAGSDRFAATIKAICAYVADPFLPILALWMKRYGISQGSRSTKPLSGANGRGAVQRKNAVRPSGRRHGKPKRFPL